MCKKVDCIYHTPNYMVHECNYCFITGSTKIGGMPYGETYSVDNCPYYQCGVRIKASKESPLATPDNIIVKTGLKTLRENEDKVMQMYNSGMNDVDIAKTFGVSVNTIARWRKKHCLKPMKHKSADWDGIVDALKQGYSHTAISVLFNIDKSAVEIYSERKKLNGRNE